MCSHLQQDGGGLQVSTETGVYQGCVAVMILLVKFCVALQQKRQHLNTTSTQQRRHTLVNGFESTAPLPSLLCSYLDVAVLAGQVKRRGTLVGAGVDVGALADQQGGQLRVAVQGGDVERCESVDVAAVDAESSGLQDRELEDTKRGDRLSGEVSETNTRQLSRVHVHLQKFFYFIYLLFRW